MTSLAPVVLFTYNRPAHTRRTLEALRANALADSSVLHVFCDGPRIGGDDSEQATIEEVRRIVQGTRWCDEVVVHTSDQNLGLAVSIRSGIDWMMSRFDRVIVLEDDIVTAPDFLTFMNDALRVHEQNPRVMHVTGFLPETTARRRLPETFLARYMNCWGWATWSRAWRQSRWEPSQLLNELTTYPGGRDEFDLDGTADFSNQLERNANGDLKSWAAFWAASIYLAGGLCLFPRNSLVRNIGVDGTGENFRTDQTVRYSVELGSRVVVKPIPVRESRQGRDYLRAFHAYGKDSGYRRRMQHMISRVRSRLVRSARRFVRR